MRRIAMILAGAGALAACGRSEPAGPQSPERLEFMTEVMEPTAEVIWDSAGYVITAEGERDLSPSTDAGWEAVALGAQAVSDAGQRLMQPPLAYDPDNWTEFAQGIVDAGELAEDAANAHDSEALFEVGAQLYRVCVACHQFYRVGEFAEEE